MVQDCVYFPVEDDFIPVHELDVPRDFSDNLTDELSALAQMAFHARDSRLWLAGCDFLFMKYLISL